VPIIVKASVLFSLLLSLPGQAGTVQACSTFLLKRSDALLVGHNLDQPNIPMQPGMVVVNKRGFEKEARTWLDLTSNEKPGKRLRWVSKYGSITCNAMGREFPDGGMNEAGLALCEMTLPGTRFPKGDDIQQMFLVQWIQHLLDTCGSVDQAVANAENIALTGWQNAWHFFVADAAGRAAVIEFLDEKPVIYTGVSLPVPALCNSTYAEELKRLQAHKGFGGRKRVSKSDRDPRFAFAAQMLKNDNSSQPPVEYGFSILDRLSISCTQWSILYDIANQRVHFRTSAARDVRCLSFSACDFSGDTPAMAIDINADLKGDIEAEMQPCTAGMNRTFVSQDIERISQMSPWLVQMLTLRGITQEIFIDRLATYPETTRIQSKITK
jgi:penicillin V acylase-like amidase (Ntn superfamily)